MDTLDMYHHAAAYAAHNTAEAVTSALAALPFDPLNIHLTAHSASALSSLPSLAAYDFDAVLAGAAADAAIAFDPAPAPATAVTATPKRPAAAAAAAAAASAKAPGVFSPLRASDASAPAGAHPPTWAPALPLPALPPLALPAAALTAAATADSVVGAGAGGSVTAGAAAATDTGTGTGTGIGPLPPAAATAAALLPGALVGLGPYAALFAAPPTDASEVSSSALSQLPLLPPAAVTAGYGSASPESPDGDGASPPHSPDLIAAGKRAAANSKAGPAHSGGHTPPPPPLSPVAAGALAAPKPHSATAAAAAAAGASRTATLLPRVPSRAASPPKGAAAAAADDEKREKDSPSPTPGDGKGDADDLRRKRLDRKAELARKNRLDKKRKLGDLEQTVAQLKQQLDEARQLNGALSTALSAAQANAPAAEAKALSAQWLDEGSAARAVVTALSTAAKDGPAVKRQRTDDSADSSTAPSAADKMVAGSVEQLLGVWAHNNTATQHALRTLEQATTSATSGLTAQFVTWLMAADNNSAVGPSAPLSTTAGATGAAVAAQAAERRVSAVWQRVFVREVGVTPSQLSSLLALQSALTTTASADAFAASLVDGPPVVPGTGPAADDVGRAYTRLALGLARRARAATVALQAMQNVLSSEQMAKLVRCAMAMAMPAATAAAPAPASTAAAAAAAAPAATAAAL